MLAREKSTEPLPTTQKRFVLIPALQTPFETGPLPTESKDSMIRPSRTAPRRSGLIQRTLKLTSVEV
jgi:hypothetical protein